jgi:hypothetical protein
LKSAAEPDWPWRSSVSSFGRAASPESNDPQPQSPRHGEGSRITSRRVERGRLYLCFERPSHGQVARILSACTEFLQLEGFGVTDVVRREPRSKPSLGIIAAANV